MDLTLPAATAPTDLSAADALALAAHTEPAGAAGRPAFADFYTTHHADLVRLAALVVGDTTTAHDLVQDAFARLQPRYDTLDDPLPYARRVVVNACRSHRRRGRLEERTRARLWRDDRQAPAADPLDDVLARLPARQRAAVVLRYWAGLPDREIAHVLGCRPGTVASLVHRALSRLREELEP